MKGYQKKLIESYKRVDAECKADPVGAAIVPVFVKKMERAIEIIAKIEELAPQQVASTTGITTEKNNLKDDIYGLIYDVASAICAYAHDQKMITLYEKTDFPYDDISKMSVADLLIFADMILNELKQIAPDDMKEYGIQPEEVVELSEMVSKLRLTSNDKKLAIIDRSFVTDQINMYCAELQEIKKNSLRKLVGQYERKAPVLYFKLKAAMIVGSASGRKSNTKKSTDTDTTATKA